MALDDLTASMLRMADFLDQTFLKDTGMQIRALKDRIDKARSENATYELKKALVELRTYFEGLGGGLYDVLFSKANNNIPIGMTAEAADGTWRELLDDLFFNLLFWDTDKKKAQKAFGKAMTIYNKMLDKSDEKFLKEHPEWTEKYRRGENARLLVGEYFHWDPDWFKEWSDLGKLEDDAGTEKATSETR